MMKIKIYGSGCPRCKQTEKVFKKAVEELQIEADVEKITDMMEIMNSGIVSTPGVSIDDEVVLTGKIPKIEEAKELIKKKL